MSCEIITIADSFKSMFEDEAQHFRIEHTSMFDHSERSMNQIIIPKCNFNSYLPEV
jgi:hypothetical protein